MDWYDIVAITTAITLLMCGSYLLGMSQGIALGRVMRKEVDRRAE